MFLPKVQMMQGFGDAIDDDHQMAFTLGAPSRVKMVTSLVIDTNQKWFKDSEG